MMNQFKMNIELQENQKLYITSDTHYDHFNICDTITRWEDKSGCRRFDSLEEMNQTLVDGINSRVKENDVLVHLGDWSFGGFDKIETFYNLLNCNNIYIFYGNHDHHIKRNKHNIRNLFKGVEESDVLVIKDGINQYEFVCNHRKIHDWGKDKERIHLHGHSHFLSDRKITSPKSMDVGMDGNDFKPYELNEILKIFNM